MGIKQPLSFLVGSRHISWVFKISLFYRTSIKTLKQKTHPPLGHRNNELETRSQRSGWAGTRASCADPQRLSPSLGSKEHRAGSVRPERENKHHWQPRREVGLRAGSSGVLSRTASKEGGALVHQTRAVRRGAEGPPWQPVSRYGCRAERQKGIPRLPLSLRWILGPGDGLVRSRGP